MSTLTIQSARPRADRAQFTPVAASGSLRQRGTGQCRVSAFRARIVGSNAQSGVPEYVNPVAATRLMALLLVQDRPIKLQQEETLITAAAVPQPFVVSGEVDAFAAIAALSTPITITDPSNANAAGLAGKPISGPLNPTSGNVLVTSKARTPQLTGWMILMSQLDLWCNTNAAVVDGEGWEGNCATAADGLLDTDYNQIILDYRLYTQAVWQSGYLNWTPAGGIPTVSQVVGITVDPAVQRE